MDRDGGSGTNPDDTIFPADLFAYLFGIPRADYQEIKDRATSLSDCGTLTAASSGLFWYNGNGVDCDLGVNGTMGSWDAPILLVVEDSDIKINSGLEFFGYVYSFDNPDNGTSTAQISLSGSPRFYGGIINDHTTLDLSATGSFSARYDATVAQNIQKSLSDFGIIPGSWSDRL